MYKVFAAVMLMFVIPSSYAFENLSQIYQTKKLIRAQLWHEGIQVNNEKSDGYQVKKTEIELPEEIRIPLELLES